MYCQIKNTSLFFIVILFAVSDVNGSDYTRLINPPLTITINGESQQLTGGLNRPEPQFIDWNNDGILDCFINDRDGRLQFWEGLEDWQFGDRPIFAMQTKFFQYLEIGNWFNFNDFDGDGDFDLLCNTTGTDRVSYFTNTNGQLELVNSELRTTSGFPVFGGQVVIPTITDINNDGVLDYFVGDISGRLAYYAGEGFSEDGPEFELVTDFFQDIQIVWTPGRHGANSIVFSDIDNDSDLDLIWGDFYQPGLFLLENYGDSNNPMFIDSLMVTNFPQAGLVETAGFNVPRLVDFEPDGDLDIVVGVLSGAYGTDYINNLAYYKNHGTSEQYDFQLITRNLLPGLDLISGTVPVLADIDGDNDEDLIIGTEFDQNNSGWAGRLYYFENITNNSEPEYILANSSFIDYFNTTNLAPSFYDTDDDGDLDAIIGEFNGYLLHYINTGSGWWEYNGHFLDLDLTGKTIPAWGDIDQDNDDDLVIGTKDGVVSVYINNGNINNLEFVTQIDIGDDAAPTILSNGSIIAGNEAGELRLLYYDSGSLMMADMPEYPYSGKNLTPYPLPNNESQEFENLLIGSKAGGIQYLFYNTLSIDKGNESVATEFNIDAVYPNPNNGHCKINLNIDKVGEYDVSVFDIHGRIISKVYNGPLGKGKYTFSLQEFISSGVYFIRLQKDDVFVIKKFIRLK